MMRNCFKRPQDGASVNPANNNTSGITPHSGKQTNTHVQPSPLTTLSHNQQKPSNKAQRSTTINTQAQQQHPTYILPATTQSRTLQQQQQQKLMSSQTQSQSQLQQSASSKSVTNISQSTGKFINSSNHNANTIDHHHNQKPGSTTNNAYGLRPESGKKRTSFLLNTQGSNASLGGKGMQHRGSAITKAKVSNLILQKQSSHPADTDINGPQQQSHHIKNDSPGKRTTQPRKPSGKGIKSTRQQPQVLSKKQITASNSGFQGVGQSSLLASNMGLHHNNSTLIQHQIMQKQNIAPQAMLSKDEHQDSRHNAMMNNQSQRISNSQNQQPPPRSLSNARPNNSNNIIGSHATQQPLSAYMGTKTPQNNIINDVSSRIGGAKSQLVAGQPVQSASVTHKSTAFQAHNTTTGKPQEGVNKVMHNIIKPNTVGLSQSNSLAVMSNSSKNLVEQGAVAAVVPQTTSHASHSTSVGDSQRNNITGANTNSSSRSQAASQNFLPNIGNNTSLNNQSQSNTNLVANPLYASTSPYHSLDESNIPLQQLGSNNPNTTSNSTTNQYQQPSASNDYFNLKQSQSVKVGSGPSAIRSTSQPHNQGSLTATKTAAMNASQPQLSKQNNAAAPIHGSATTQMQNILSKGLRASSEPAQPQLKSSDSTASFKENFRQRAAFTVVMKAAMQPKQPKTNLPRSGTEAQMASADVKATVAKLLQKNQPQTTLPFFQTSKISSKAFGGVKAFAANTNVGIVRKANEDRISIILNVIQPAQKAPRVPAEKWPKLQIFGVYDGHGGSKCAEYLKDNLHNNIILQPDFPQNIPEAIRKGCYKTEDLYLQLVCPSPDQPHNKAGSCAIMILVVNDDIWIVNVGDSRALGSISEHPSDSMIQSKANQMISNSKFNYTDNSQTNALTQVHMEATSLVKELSRDHKPSDQQEYNRIVQAGGYVYQTQTVMNGGMPTTMTQQVRQEACPQHEDSDDEDNPFVGPYRVFPGRLSVCRTFGDCEAKLAYLGGMSGVVTCEPENTYEKSGCNYLDYVLIASDGVFDKLKNDQINGIVWDITTKARQQAHSTGQVPSIHSISGQVADEILHQCAKHRSLDNLSIVFVAFQKFKNYIEMFKQEIAPPAPIGINLQQVTAGLDSDQAQKSYNSVVPMSNLNKTPQRSIQRKVSGTQGSYQRSDEIPNENMNSLPKVVNNFSEKQLQKNSASMYKLDQVQANGQSSQFQQQMPYSNSTTNNQTNSGSGHLLLKSQNKSQSMQHIGPQMIDGNNQALQSSGHPQGNAEKGQYHTNQQQTSQYAIGNNTKLQQLQHHSSSQQIRHHQSSNNLSGASQGAGTTTVLENINGHSNNRPSSRNAGGSRKGNRTRKGNQTVGIASSLNQSSQSHSQDTRPTLPQVHHTNVPNHSQVGNSNQGKLAYTHQLSETKGNNGSSSASALPTSLIPNNMTGQLSSSNGQVYTNNRSREQTNSAHQNRKGGLFKVNTATNGASNNNGANNNAPSIAQLMQKNNGMSSSNSVTGTKQLILNNSESTQNQQQQLQNQMLMGHHDPQPRSLSSQNQQIQQSQTSQSQQAAASIRKQKLKQPYKSNQTRRMPDNPGATSANTAYSNIMNKQRDASSTSEQTTSVTKTSQQHKF